MDIQSSLSFLETFWENVNLNFFLAVSCFILFIGLEFINKRPRVSWQRRKTSYFSNFLILSFNNFVMFLISGTSLYLVASTNSFKLIGYVSNPALKFIISLLLFDFLIYFWHVLNHRLPFLWRFHSCHHSDKDLNSSTSFRFHLGELFLSLFYKSIFIFLIGVEAQFVFLYEALIFCFAAFHHSDIKVPFEKYLRYVIVVPMHHSTHHSLTRENHDSNYAVIFSFWDRIFRTYNPYQPQEFGLANKGEKRFFSFLSFAFEEKQGLVWLMIFFGLLVIAHIWLRMTLL